MDIGAPIRAFDRFQQRHKPLGIPIAVLKKFADDSAGNKAALIAYFGFFSIFPLLLLFVTILGFVLHGNPSAQHAVLNSALKQFPIVGSSLGKTQSLSGNPIGLAVGIVGALLSGLGITMAAQNAFNAVYAVPHKERPDFLSARLRGIKLLVVFGVLQLVSTVVSGVVAGGFGGVGLTIAGIVVSLILNLVLFFAVFRLLTDSTITTRELWPGIAVAAVLWEVLQSVGGVYIGHVVKGGGQTYGTFAVVIGLLVWLYLGARVVVYSAEINTVLTRGLWPRSIMDPPIPADRKVRAALAKVEERDDKQSVDVTFHPDQKEEVDPGNPEYAVAPEPAHGEEAQRAPWSEDQGTRPAREDEAAQGQPATAGRAASAAAPVEGRASRDAGVARQPSTVTAAGSQEPRTAAAGSQTTQGPDGHLPAPGTEEPRRLHPRLRYELVSCGLSGHELIGTDAAELRDSDWIVARDDQSTGLRWHRCLRCDSWLALPPPAEPRRRHPPDRDELELPLRGRPLRDKYVLRLIALDRAFHFLVLAALAVALWAIASHRASLQHTYYRVLLDIHGAVGGPTSSGNGILHDLSRIFSLHQNDIRLLGFVAGGYAVLEGVEAVGLWLRKRWAEYLTFIATTLLLIPEVYELTNTITVFKILALVINLLVVAYLLFAKRLFGLRGGGGAERAEIERDSGWEALERTTPRPPRSTPPATHAA